MSMLDRYRKPGGFYQLVSLVETCAPAKKEKFLELIRAESSAWAEAVKEKMLDIPRIYSWSDETLAEVFGTLQDLTVALSLHSADETLKSRVFGYMTQGRKRKIDDILSTHTPTPNEIAATHVKIIETVRKMAHDGYLRFEKIDPVLHFDEKFEDELNKSDHGTASILKGDFTIEYDTEVPGEGEESSAASHSSTADNDTRTAEILSLKRKVLDMSKENAVLRHELSIAKNKLEQIKKIA